MNWTLIIVINPIKMSNRTGGIHDENQQYNWDTLQKAIKKIKEQQKIIDSLALYIINHEKTKAGEALADKKGEGNNDGCIKKATKKKVKPRETLKKTIHFGYGKMSRQG